jgi:arsenate reductase (glutaredoxin)
MVANYVLASIVSVHQGQCAAVQNTPMSNTASTVTIFGISNCDTVKKARVWLNERGVNAVFHDFKKAGLPNEAELDSWFAAHDWATVINTKGTTWRTLDPETQRAVVDVVSAKTLAKTYPSIIKRPVVRWPNGRITVGFVPTDWRALID